MNFALARSNYKGKLNFLAYIGMLGDIAALGLAYALYRYNKERKIKNLSAKFEENIKEQL